MCVTCGCGDTEGVTLSSADGEHEHVHADGTRHTHTHADGSHHSHAHSHGDAVAFAQVPLRQPTQVQSHSALAVPGRDSHTIQLETQILGKNQLLAERNRGWLSGRQILALNLVSSPGAGKTALLERTLNDLKAELKISVVEGDQATSNDAERIRATGVRAVQINTGTGCHLEADMLERALRALNPELASLLLIENVGNLVCPALFDLGERAKVVIFSVTEGEDKPLKYPHMFGAAEVLILSKIDLLPHVRFDPERAIANALTVNPRLTVFRVSTYTGEGMREWYDWLKGELALSMNGGSHATSWQPVSAG
jgi:hydrogenase nickel incorporation protein HypB